MHAIESNTDGDGMQVREDGAVSSAALEFTRWRDGDPRALDSLVRGFTGVLWHVVRAYGLDAGTAEDVVQFTWLALIRHSDGIRDPQAVAGWLITVARREAARTARSRRHEVLEVEQAAADRPAPDPAPDDVVVTRLDSRILWRHVARLSERCRRLLRVIAFSEHPDYPSLSAELGMPVGGIGPTRRRCLDKLRLSLAADPAWSAR